MPGAIELSEAYQDIAAARASWAERSPLRNCILRQDGIFAAIFTVFAVFCAIVFLSLLIRPINYLSVGTNWVLGRIRLKSYVPRHPTVCVISCQVGALALSSNWWSLEVAPTSLVGLAATTSLWIVDLGVLLYALPFLGQRAYPTTLGRLRRINRRRWPERWFAAHMRNPLDAHFVRVAILSTMVMAPAWIVLFQDNGLFPMHCIFFVISFGQNGLRQEFLDHTNMHNRLFRCKRSATRLTRAVFRLTNIYLAYILNPMCLRVPFLYDVQHLCVHHVENNGLNDVQSTVLYDRRSFIDFCKFSLFVAWDFCTAALTIAYLRRKANLRPIRIAVRGLVLWYIAMAGLWLLNPAATAFVLCYRFAIMFCASFGAFSWHGFADPDDPENIFRNSVNVVLPNDERDCFGNFYHIEHHLRPGLHWSKVADFSLEKAEGHTAHDALEWHLGRNKNFSGERIMKAIWLDRLDALLPLFAGWKNAVSDAEALKIMHQRTLPAFPVTHSAMYARLDRKLGAFVARYLLVGKLPRKKRRAAVPAMETDAGAS